MGGKEITFPSQTGQMVLKEVFNSRQVATSRMALAVEHADMMHSGIPAT